MLTILITNVMKKLTSLLVLYLFTLQLFAAEYVSRIDNEHCKQMTVTMDNKIAYVKISSIDDNSGILENWLNGTAFEIKDGQDTIPTGIDAIFIPFNGGDPLYIQNGGTISRSCDCYSGSTGGIGGGTCTPNSIACPDGAHCHECHWTSTGKTGANIIIVGGGVLVEATSIVFQ